MAHESWLLKEGVGFRWVGGDILTSDNEDEVVRPRGNAGVGAVGSSVTTYDALDVGATFIPACAVRSPKLENGELS